MSDRDANLLGAASLAVADLVTGVSAGIVESSFPAAALVHLSHCKKPSVESLRRVLGLSHSATVRLADRMANAGLLARAEAAWDPRAVALRLTPRGSDLAVEVLGKRAQALDAALAQTFTEIERQALGEMMGRLLAVLTNNSDDLYRICRLCDFAACPSCPVAGALAP